MGGTVASNREERPAAAGGPCRGTRDSKAGYARKLHPSGRPDAAPHVYGKAEARFLEIGGILPVGSPVAAASGFASAFRRSTVPGEGEHPHVSFLLLLSPPSKKTEQWNRRVKPVAGLKVRAFRRRPTWRNRPERRPAALPNSAPRRFRTGSGRSTGDWRTPAGRRPRVRADGSGADYRSGAAGRPPVWPWRPGSSSNGRGRLPCTEKQVRALHAFSRRAGVELTEELRRRFGLTTAEELSRRQASEAIDGLKERAGN
ncbi:hypothetical protein CA12_24990 [Alienimonas californiensis]|uniref:Uncharacterized protein n=1 Tax=Alienimonas californiensis TaxID=2527989 RepID=A0A517PAJ1_9PLAN|nr:hypothetical protein CA12_24990 [Alienimonas californiensis]